MRILVATHNFPRFAGDHAGSFVARLCEGLAGRGHSVLVVAPHAPGIPRAETMRGVHVQRFRYAPDALERVAYRGDLHRRSAFDPAAVMGVPALLLAYARAVRHEVRRFAPDVVHAHWWFPGGAFAVRSGASTVITCHGSDVRLLDRGGPVRAAGRATLRRAAAVTCASAFLTRDVEQAVPELAGSVRTIYMPLETGPFDAARGTQRAEPPTILFVGNLVPSKGTAVLIEAFAKLRSEGIDCRLRIVGDGPERHALEALAARLGVSAGVAWAGFVPHDRIANEHARATIVVLPSRANAEGLGLVLAEALLAGTAVVGSPAGGIPEVVVDEETGLIARDGDAAHLAAQLRRLLGDPLLRERLAAAGAARARRLFSADAATTAFDAVFTSVRNRTPSLAQG